MKWRMKIVESKEDGGFFIGGVPLTLTTKDGNVGLC